MMSLSSPCRLACPPFTIASPQRRGRVLVHASTPRLGSASYLPVAGLTHFVLPGYAWAEDIVSDIQNSAPSAEAVKSLPESLPQSLPAAEEVVKSAPTSGGSLLDIFTDNPIVIFGLLFLAAIPVILNFFSGGALGVKQVNAAGAVEGLTSDPKTVLVDIRGREEVKGQGSPDLSSTKKKAIILPFTRLVKGEPEQVEDFAERFSKLKQIESDTSIILLDSFGEEAPEAAKLLAKSYGRVYYVRDGAVGINGWKESGQAWKEPGKSFLNLDSLAEDFRSQPTLTKAGVAVGAVGVASAVLFQEAGAVLELAALAAAGAFALPRFLNTGSSSEIKEEAQGLVKKSESAAKQTAGRAKSASKKAKSGASEAAEEVQDTDLGAKAQGAVDSVQDAFKGASSSSEPEAEKAANQATNAAGDIGEKVEDAASDVKDSIAERSGEARKWIDNWKNEQAK